MSEMGHVSGQPWATGPDAGCVREGLQPVEPVRHDVEQAGQSRQNCSGCAHHHAHQPTKISVVLCGKRIYAVIEPIHTIVCVREASLKPPLDPLQRGRGRTGNLFENGDPGFHFGRISAGVAGFNGTVRHVRHSMINGGWTDAEWQRNPCVPTRQPVRPARHPRGRSASAARTVPVPHTSTRSNQSGHSSWRIDPARRPHRSSRHDQRGAQRPLTAAGRRPWSPAPASRR